MTVNIHTGTDGSTRYKVGDQFHRLDGPAIKWPSGAELWYKNGKLHRTDGPAVIFATGYKEWWIDHVEYEPTKWLLKLYELGLK